MSQPQIDYLLDFSTPFDDQKLQTFDLVAQHLQSNQPQSVSTLFQAVWFTFHKISKSRSYLFLDRVR
jgi:hypothetical protein